MPLPLQRCTQLPIWGERENNVFILVQGQKCESCLPQPLSSQSLSSFDRLVPGPPPSFERFLVQRTGKRSILALKVKCWHYNTSTGKPMHASIPYVGIKVELITGLAPENLQKDKVSYCTINKSSRSVLNAPQSPRHSTLLWSTGA